MERTKVVIRKLPPSIVDADVRELVDSTSAKYNWYSFVQGKTRCAAVPATLSFPCCSLYLKATLCWTCWSTPSLRSDDIG